MSVRIKSLMLFFYVFGAICLIGPTYFGGHHSSANSLPAVDSLPSARRLEPSVAQCPDARESSLPLPSSMSPDAFHDKLLAFLQNTEYVKLNWCVDKDVRDTGPYVSSEYLGVH